MIEQLISDNYDFLLDKLELLESHFGTEISLARTDKGKYIVKKLPIGIANLEDEGHITSFLSKHGISVAKLIKTQSDTYVVRTDTFQFTVQEFVDGITLAVNTAPGWFLDLSAQTLGKIHTVLKDYGTMKQSFGMDFFNVARVSDKEKFLNQLLISQQAKNDRKLLCETIEQIKHAHRIMGFEIDTKKLTYSNSHGDYYISQVITKDRNFTIIDWSSACSLPICNEIIMSYVFADPLCKTGEIDSARLKNYVEQYAEHSSISLSKEDLALMPYVFYYHQFMTNYTPPFSNVPESYRAVSKLINNILNWLYQYVDSLSAEMSA